jgi:hypothetical protein
MEHGFDEMQFTPSVQIRVHPWLTSCRISEMPVDGRPETGFIAADSALDKHVFKIDLTRHVHGIPGFGFARAPSVRAAPGV